MSDHRSSAVPVVMMLCLLGMCAVIGLLFNIAEPEGGHGVAHSQFASTMHQGDTGSDRLIGVRGLGLIVALLQVIFFVVILLLGTRHRGPVLICFTISGLFYADPVAALIVTE